MQATRTSLMVFDRVSFSWPESVSPVFEHFSAEIPRGFLSLVGPNGSGKTTFMLLGGGRITPQQGRIELLGHNTRILSGQWADESGTPGPGLTEQIENMRNGLCSFIYQNMEFDEENGMNRVFEMLEFVYNSGGYSGKDTGFYQDVLSVFELGHLGERRLNALSKGELQRVLLAFSALYGSRAIMMDEPLFAMEMKQKEKALDFFGDIYRSRGVSIIVSLHELSLTRKYAETVLLFYPDRRIDMGSCEEVLTREALEVAYGVPEGMLYDTERLTRSALLEEAALENAE